MNHESMLVTLYSRKALPVEFRDIFELPFDPYSEDVGEIIEVEKYLRDLHTVFYRDEFNTGGVIYKQEDFDLYTQGGWEAFRNTMYLELKTYKISGWPEKMDRLEKRERGEYIEKHGDKAWLMWNKEVIVSSMDERQVHLA